VCGGGFLIGSRKGNPVAGLLMGILLGPLGVVIALLSGDKNRAPCMHCAELILKKATICPHCSNPQATREIKGKSKT
jgi:hypothetical protein